MNKSIKINCWNVFLNLKRKLSFVRFVIQNLKIVVFLHACFAWSLKYTLQQLVKWDEIFSHQSMLFDRHLNHSRIFSLHGPRFALFNHFLFILDYFWLICPKFVFLLLKKLMKELFQVFFHFHIPFYINRNCFEFQPRHRHFWVFSIWRKFHSDQWLG